MIGIINFLISAVLLVLLVVQLILRSGMMTVTVILWALFLLSSVQLFSTGILAQYLSKTYMESKHRPIYLMRENEEIYRSRRQAK